MREPEFSDRERDLMDESARLLARDRAARSPEARRALTGRVMGAVADEPVRGRFWRARQWLLVAAAVALVFVLLQPREQAPASMLDQARRDAERYAVTRGTVDHQTLFLEHEGQNLVAMIHNEPERCLWLFPEEDILVWEANASEEDLARQARWRVPVAEGRLTVPDEILARTFEPDAELVLMRFRGHYEIWDSALLTRHLNAN